MEASLSQSDLQQFVLSQRAKLAQLPLSVREGRVKRVSGLLIEVEGLPLSMGAQACVENTRQGAWVDAECIGFESDTTFLMAFDQVHGLSPGAVVYPLLTPLRSAHGYQMRHGVASLPIGPQLLGRVVDGLGRPLDGLGGASWSDNMARFASPNPLKRAPIHEALDTGVRAINSMLTVGRGQRLGLFAGSGVGKSVLLSMLTRNCVADVIVIALVGERSREVREFCEDQLDDVSRARAVVVASPADTSPLARAKGAEYATDVATWFRDQGKHVVLIVDSLTRYAMAQREIGLSLGEPPVARGYPASVFGRLPALVEKVGNGENAQGSLTAFYTVLLEGDDVHDPVADAARGVLDGHIFLSRELADSGHYPAIDHEKSISRVMPKVASQEHVLAARRVKQLISRHVRSRDMVAMGAYMAGTDPDLDAALKLWPRIQTFLQQESHQVADMAGSIGTLMTIARASQA
ncbi:MAG: FliI/YscN family ATPase [Betaproteobacteria bacterium]|jgi:flagellum-specific ATP synthase|nr:FliI/YscN family ATPase [Betaproteobacteria bacterium]